MPSPTRRTRLVQFDVAPGRPADNTARMLEAIRQAQSDGVELLVFPEMAVPGYLLGDAWERESFLRECERCGREIQAAAGGTAVVFGSVGLDWKRRNEDGRVRKYNALFVAHEGRFLGPSGGPYPFVVKTLLPNYREFDDSRHFHDLRKLALELDRPLRDLLRPVELNGLALGCMLCEDAWDSDYGFSPLAALAAAGADVLINISSSPFTVNKDRKRRRVFARRVAALRRPLLYVNNVGLQNNGKTVFTFDGASCAYDARGGVLPAGAPFEETVLTLDLAPGPAAAFGRPLATRGDTVAEIAGALLYGTGRFMALCGAERVVVGVSGGIDSAVVAALYRRLLAPRDLLLVNMPGPYTSETTRGLARELTANLGCLGVELPIGDSVALTRRQVDGCEARSADGALRERLALTGFNMENVQARDRSARVLAAVASAFGGVFTCNANKSEATVGYTTFYGDLAGYLAGIADLWKTEVYALARHLNTAVYGRAVIPAGILDIVPSAELSAAQDVERGQGDPLVYPYHDALFRSWVEHWNRATPEDILAWYREGVLEEKIGYDGKVEAIFDGPAALIRDLERWWDLYQGTGVAKRIQAPPVLAVKRRAFGFDHRESQLGATYTRRYAELKASLLT